MMRLSSIYDLSDVSPGVLELYGLTFDIFYNRVHRIICYYFQKAKS